MLSIEISYNNSGMYIQYKSGNEVKNFESEQWSVIVEELSSNTQQEH